MSFVDYVAPLITQAALSLIGEVSLMFYDLKKAACAGLLFAALITVSQPASFAGLADLFGGKEPPESTDSATTKSQKADMDAANKSVNDKDDDDTRLTPKGVRSAVHELFHDEFSDDNGDKKLANANKTIAKGEKMMQACGDNHDKPEYKKGKIMKEIGEKEIADLKAKGVFNSGATSLDPERPTKVEKPDSL